jgi:hypothetical protein
VIVVGHARQKIDRVVTMMPDDSELATQKPVRGVRFPQSAELFERSINRP